MGSAFSQGHDGILGFTPNLYRNIILTFDTTAHAVDGSKAVSPTEPTSNPAIDYKTIRKALKIIEEREALGKFVKAGWTAAEFAEYARSMYLLPGRTKPTAVSYRFVLEYGPDHEFSKNALAFMRAPGYILPPIDRPEPKHFDWDDYDYPNHAPELRAEVEELARLLRKRSRLEWGKPLPDPVEPISRWWWKKSIRIRDKYLSVEDAIEALNLLGYQ